MVFVLCLGFFVTPAVLGGGKVIMVSMKIVSQHRAVRELGGGQRAWCGASGTDRRCALDRVAIPEAGADDRGWALMIGWLKNPASETQITHGQRLWLYIFAVITMILLVTPTLIVIPMSFSASQYLEFPPETWSTRWYQHYFASEEWMQATRTSFKAAFLTMLFATPIGVLAAYGLHASKLPFIRVAFVMLITPMMVPVVLVAIGAFYAYVKLQIPLHHAGAGAGRIRSWLSRWF